MKKSVLFVDNEKAVAFSYKGLNISKNNALLSLWPPIDTLNTSNYTTKLRFQFEQTHITSFFYYSLSCKQKIRSDKMNRVRFLFSGQKPVLLRAWLGKPTTGQSRKFANLTRIAQNSVPNCIHRPVGANNSKNTLLCSQPNRKYSATEATSIVSQLDYESFCTETLDCLTDYVEELVESTSRLEKADVVNKVSSWTCSLVV